MSFVTAWLALAGLAAAVVPIAIHLLLRRRRAPQPWAAMRLLRQALREQTKRLRLEQLIVLALRCILLAAVGAAAAQPLLRAAGLLEERGGRTLFLVIDDGLLSGVRLEPGAAGPGAPGTALEGQVETALALLDALQPGDEVGVIAAGRPVRGIVVPPTTNHAQVRSTLERLHPRDGATDLPGAIAGLREVIDRVPEERSVAVYLLSGFRRGSAPLDRELTALVDERTARDGARLELFATSPAEDEIENVQVTAIEPLRRLLLPGQSDGSGQVTVRLRRFGALPEAVSELRVRGAGVREQAPRRVRWEAGRSEASTELLLETALEEASGPDDAASAPTRGVLGATIDLVADDLPGDDARSIVLETRRAVKVLLLDRRSFGGPSVERLSAGQWLGRALQPSEAAPIEVVVEDPARLDERLLRGVDVAVAARPDLLDASGWRALEGHLERGGLLIVLPPDELRVHGWLDEMQERFVLPWRLELEAIDTPAGLALAERQPPGTLLQLLENELPDLVAPVRVFRRLPVDAGAAPSDVVLAAEDGSPLILAAAPRRVEATQPEGADAARREPYAGQLILFAVAPALEWTDLPTKPAMVPLIQELVRQGVGLGSRGAEATVGERVLVPSSARELAPIEERAGDGGAALVAVHDGRSDPVPGAGLHRVVDAAGQTAGLVAVNVDAEGGDPTPQSADAVLAWLGTSGPWRAIDRADPAAALLEVESGRPISAILLAVALLAAVLETIFARRFSHATIRRDERTAPEALA